MPRHVFVFDIDGVLADFILGFTARAAALFPLQAATTVHSTVEHARWGDFPGLSSEDEAVVWESIQHDPTFWKNLPDLCSYDEWSVLKTLTDRADVYFATNRSGVNPLAQTRAWLIAHGITDPNIVITKYKGEFCRIVAATYAIDDKADNASCIAWNSQREGRITIPYLIDRPYNRYDHEIIGSKHVRRVSTVAEYLSSCFGVLG